MDEVTQESLPDAQDDVPHLLDQLPIVQDGSKGALVALHEIQSIDAQYYNNLLLYLQQGWKLAFNIDDICKLAITTSKVIQERRQALCLPWGAATAPAKKNIGYGVFDD